MKQEGMPIPARPRRRGAVPPTWVLLAAALLTAGRSPAQSTSGIGAYGGDYSCEIVRETCRGPVGGPLEPQPVEHQKVLKIGGAYRIESWTEGGLPEGRSILLNDGGGDGTEFLYRPATKRAFLNLNSVRWKYARKYPDAWRKQAGFPAPRPACELLRVHRRGSDPLVDRAVNPSLVVVAVPSPDPIEGRRCRALRLTYHPLTARGPDRETRIRWTFWTCEKTGLILREEFLTDYLGDAKPRPYSVRRVVSVRDLSLEPRAPRGAFQLPPGTVCEIFSEWRMELPPGVRPVVIPGTGLSFEPPRGVTVR
jgi:hypothetical protein